MSTGLDAGRRSKTRDPRRNYWETPTSFYKTYDDEFHFSIDVAANESNTKCPLWFDENDDALKLNWVKTAKAWGVRPIFWMNCPYSNVGSWMAKAYKESLRGATVVCLVGPGVGSKWWHNYAMKGEIRFIKGRVQFIPPPGIDASTNSRDSIIVVLRPPTL